MDQYGRKQDVIVNGLEEKEEEDDEELLDAIQEVAKSLEVLFELGDVNTYHRMVANKH